MEDATYIQFDKYLNNELSKEELISFEKELANNIELNQEFKIYQALESSLSSKFENEESELELRNTLTNLGSTYIKEDKTIQKKSKVISLFNYKKIMVAASIALIIGFFLFKDSTPVYGDFANHNNLELVVRGDNNGSLLTTEKAFNEKNYEEALKELHNLSNIFPEDVEIQLYIGICNLELDNFNEADVVFNNISTGTSSFATTATWYKALSLLKQEKFSECKKVLKTIPKTAPEYEQAQKLIKKL